MNIRWDLLWEAVKLPLRLFVFGLFSFALTQVSIFVAEKFGVTITDDMKGQLSVWFMGILGTTFATIDKFIHESNKEDSKKPLTGLDRGLLPF